MSSRALVQPDQRKLFFDAVRTSNPFHSNRVNEPSDATIDVPGINAQEFQELVDLAKESFAVRKGTGAMVLGGAGVGKSHLLWRLGKWANDNDVCYIFLHNVLASPDRMPRYFLRYLVSMLVQGHSRYDESPLYKMLHTIILRAVREARASNTATGRNTKSVGRREAEAAFRAVANEFRVNNDAFNHQVSDVLFHFFYVVTRHTHRDSAIKEEMDALVAWLSGDSVSEAMAARIGLKTEGAEGDAEGALRLSDEQHVEQVILLLTEVAAAAGQPFIVCVDQVDNLNEDQVKSLTRFLHALIDHAKNLLVVTAGVRQTMVNNFRDHGVIAEAAWDRLTDLVVELRRVGPDEARQIVSARLDHFLTPFRDISEVHSLLEDHELFPLPLKEFEREFGELPEVRPRDVISWAKRQWRQQQVELEQSGGEYWLQSWPHAPEGFLEEDDRDLLQRIDQRVRSKIRESVAQRLAHKGSLPPDADNLATLVESLLARCLNRPEVYSLRGIRRMAGERQAYHLEVREMPESQTCEVVNGVSFVTTRDGRSAGPALARLLKVQTPIDHRVLVTDDERAPLPQTPTVRETYDALTALGTQAFRHIRLDFQQYAELDALHGVIAQARVGDLDVEFPRGQEYSVSEDEVVESLHRQDLFRQNPVLKELIEEPEEPPKEHETVAFDEQELRATIMAHLAWNACLTTSEITEIYLNSHGAVDVSFREGHEQILALGRRMVEGEEIRAKEHDGGLLLMR